MGFLDTFLTYLGDKIAIKLAEQNKMVGQAMDYRYGKQPAQLKVKPGQFDDNLTVNFSGLIVDRSVSDMLGDGIVFDLPGEEDSPEQAYINGLMDANHSDILLLKAALAAADGGNGYIKMIPDGVVGQDGETYPRLVVLNPKHITIETLPEDHEMVIRYVIQYTLTDKDGKEKGYREITEHVPPTVDGEGVETGGNFWTVTNYETMNGRWEQVNQTTWEWYFPPIIHWQNLPNPYSAIGKPDLTDDIIELQDRINYLAANESKIIRYFAHPMRWGKNLGKYETIESGPDKMLIVGDEGEIFQLDQLGDLAAANAFLGFTRQALFDISRTVDLDSLQDKLGSLTNFGLRVLHKDSLAKIDTKRLLFGTALLAMVSRLLEMKGFENTDAGTIIWDDPIPQNEVEQMEMLEKQIDLGLVSKETASTELGRTWLAEDVEGNPTGEKVKIEREQEEARLQNDTIGGELLNRFIRGEGV